MNKEQAFEILYREFYNETREYNSSLKLEREDEDFWLVDVYKSVIPGWRSPVSVTLNGHQITLAHSIGFRVLFGCGVIYIGPHRIYVNTLQRTTSLLKFIVSNMNSLGTAMNAMTAMESRQSLEAKKDEVISSIIKESAVPLVKELMSKKNLDYSIKVKSYYISLKIGVGAKCHKEFKFSYEFFDEDYEYAKGWINGIQPGPYR